MCMYLQVLHVHGSCGTRCCIVQGVAVCRVCVYRVLRVQGVAAQGIACSHSGPVFSCVLVSRVVLRKTNWLRAQPPRGDAVAGVVGRAHQ